MLKFFRAASLVAVSCTLVSSVIAADSRAVLSNDQSAKISANASVINPTQTTVEPAQLDLPTSFPTPNDIDATTVSTLTDLVRTQAVDDSLSNEEHCLCQCGLF